jgi:hypothetical protein
MIPMLSPTNFLLGTIKKQDQEKEKKEDEMVFQHTESWNPHPKMILDSTPQTWSTGIYRDQG